MSVVDRLTEMLDQRGVAFDVLRHEAVYTSEQAARVRGTSLASGAKALVCKADGKVHIFTKQQYGDFILRLQIRMDAGGNNGIGIRTPVDPSPHLYGMEIQVLDDPYYADGDPIKLKPFQFKARN